MTTTHDDLPRVFLRDNAVEGGIHASHVAGTLSGLGYDPQAQGMAPQATVWSFSSDNVLSEIAAHAAQTSTEFAGKLFVSVHPYGVASGWEYDGEEWYGSFSNDGDNSNDVPIYLGQYSSATASWDGTSSSFPFHLLIKSSGNHGDDNAPSTGATWWLNGIEPYSYDPASHPRSDTDHTSPAGYGTIDSRGSAKNVLTVGSVSDAITGGVRDPGAAILSDLSSVGPTDDGRIKPDLVANGEDVTSVDGSTSNGYLLASGTSISSASVAGGAQLLNEIYIDSTGEAMRSALLKGLLIHTADDLELPGPDYRTGWGLANVEAAAELLYDDAANEPLERIKNEELRSDDPLDCWGGSIDGSGPVRITL